MAVILKTFLFTDIERSTNLWEADAAKARALVSKHDSILRAAIAEAHGEVFKTAGDGFLLAFPNAEDAFTCALQAQLQLTAETPDLRVRMALESGSAEARDDDYFGPVLNRVSRMLAACHGGQILAGESFVAVLHDDVHVRALGEHSLRGIDKPLNIFQIVHPDLPSEFPRLRTEQVDTPNNLPPELNSFVGREKELVRVLDLLSSSRIVTLVGSGGSGKTRLARRAADEAKPFFRGGVWWIELASLREDDKILPSIAAELKVREGSSSNLLQVVVAALDARRNLLIIDNCEHLIESVGSLVTELVESSSNISVLTTGREALGIEGEVAYRIPSLEFPGPETDAASAADCAAVQLFTQRAQAVQPDFRLSGDTVRDVINICRRLDGIPLALEMAASRLRAMPLAQLASRLDDRFSLLTGGTRTALPRQQTLRATVDWSYSLLSEQERRMLWRMAGFSGGWTLEQAEAVASDDLIPGGSVLDLLTALVEKSLVQFEATHGRYRTLETIRHYTMEKLLDSGEAEEIRKRQLGYFCREFLSRWDDLNAPPFRAEVRMWARGELDNLRGSFEWALSHSAEEAIWLMIALVYTAGSTTEAQTVLARAEAILGHCSMQSQARYLAAKGYVHFGRGEEKEARALLGRSLEQFQMLGLEREANFVRLAVTGAMTSSEPELAERILEAGIDYATKNGPTWMLAGLYNNLGEIYRLKADFDAAENYYNKARASLPRGRQPSSFLTFNLAVVAAHRGRLEEAKATLAPALASNVAKNDFSSHVLLLAAAFIFALEGEHLWSARLFGRYRRIQGELGIATQASDLPIERGVKKRLLEGLGASGLADAEGEGASLNLDDLVASAISLMQSE